MAHEKNVGKRHGLGVTHHGSFAAGTHQKIRGGYAHARKARRIKSHRFHASH